MSRQMYFWCCWFLFLRMPFTIQWLEATNVPPPSVNVELWLNGGSKGIINVKSTIKVDALISICTGQSTDKLPADTTIKLLREVPEGRIYASNIVFSVKRIPPADLWKWENGDTVLVSSSNLFWNDNDAKKSRIGYFPGAIAVTVFRAQKQGLIWVLPRTTLLDIIKKAGGVNPREVAPYFVGARILRAPDFSTNVFVKFKDCASDAIVLQDSDIILLEYGG